MPGIWEDLVVYLPMDDDKDDNVVINRAGANATYNGTGGVDDYTSAHAAGGPSLEFDGTQDHITTPIDSEAATGVTTACRFKTRDKTVSQRLITPEAWTSGGADDDFVVLRIIAGKVYVFTAWGAGAILSESDDEIENDTWYHAAAVANITEQTQVLYINGVAQADTESLVGTDPFSNTNNWSIGAATGGATNPFDGFIKEARVYNRALSPADIAELVAYRNTPTISPAIALPGVRVGVVTKPRIMDANTLLDWANRHGEEVFTPPVSISMTGVDLAKIKDAEHEELILGEDIHLIDEDTNIDTKVALISVERNLDSPGQIRIDLANERKEATDDLAEALEAARFYENPTSRLPSTSIDLKDGDPLSDWEDGETGDIDGTQISLDTKIRSLYYRSVISASGDIAADIPVYVSGFAAGNYILTAADATHEATGVTVILITDSAAVEEGAIFFGLHTFAATIAQDALLFLNPSGGFLTTRPNATNQITQAIGTCVISAVNASQVFIHGLGSPQLEPTDITVLGSFSADAAFGVGGHQLENLPFPPDDDYAAACKKYCDTQDAAIVAGAVVAFYYPSVKSAGGLAKDVPVYISGYSSGDHIVLEADDTHEVMGVTTQVLAAGISVPAGVIYYGLHTLTDTIAQDALLYLDPAGGAYTTTRPTGADEIVQAFATCTISAIDASQILVHTAGPPQLVPNDIAVHASFTADASVGVGAEGGIQLTNLPDPPDDDYDAACKKYCDDQDESFQFWFPAQDSGPDIWREDDIAVGIDLSFATGLDRQALATIEVFGEIYLRGINVVGDGADGKKGIDAVAGAGSNGVTNPGGDGGSIDIQAGDGGDATAGGLNGGAGGDIILSTGSGGTQDGAGDPGAGGEIQLKGNTVQERGFTFIAAEGILGDTVGSPDFTLGNMDFDGYLLLGGAAPGSIPAGDHGALYMDTTADGPYPGEAKLYVKNSDSTIFNCANFWELGGGIGTRLVTADDIDMQGSQILNLVAPNHTSAATNKQYVDSEIAAAIAQHVIDLH